MRRAWTAIKGWPSWAQWTAGIFVALLVIGLASEEGEEQTAATDQAPTTAPTTAVTTAVTTPPVSTAPTTAAPVVTAAPTTAAPATAPPTTAAGVNYPGKEKADRVASPNGAVELSGFTTSVSNVAREEGYFDDGLICGSVTIRNRDTKAQAYGSFDFRLQTPGGEVKTVTIAPGEDLGFGDLITGGSKTGRVCWNDPGQPGQYIVIWKPDSFRADRGIWLVTL